MVEPFLLEDVGIAPFCEKCHVMEFRQIDVAVDVAMYRQLAHLLGGRR